MSMLLPGLLPTNVDATYSDDPTRPGRKAHQQHHDLLHAFNNAGVKSFVNLASYCEGDGSDESSQLQLAVNDAASAGKSLYHPYWLSVYVTLVTQMPNDFFYWGEGELWTDAVEGDGSPINAFAFLENALWQTKGLCENITVLGIRFRRTVDVDGTEGPYDRAIRIANGKRIRLEGVESTGGMGCVLLQGCDQYSVKALAINPGDAGVTNDGSWGASTCTNGKIVAEVHNSGYLLDGVTPVPTGIAGSAVVCTQSGTEVDVNSINPRHNAFETGDNASGLQLRVKSTVTIAGRVGNVLIANCSDVTVDKPRFILRNGGVGGVNVVGSTGQSQTNIRVVDPRGDNYHTADGFNADLVTVGAHSHQVSIHRPKASRMAAFRVGAADVSDVDIYDPYSRRAPQYGGYISIGERIRVHGGEAHRPGTDGTTFFVFRAGLVVDQVGAGCSVEGHKSYDEGAGGMAVGYYVEGSTAGVTLIWSNNQSLGHTNTAVFKGGTVTLNAPVMVS